jgi:hypothetical protein
MHVREENMGRHDGRETMTPAAAALLAKIDTRPGAGVPAERMG